MACHLQALTKKISSLRSFFKYLLRNGLTDTDPTQKIRGPKTPKRLPSFVDEAQMENLKHYEGLKTEFENTRDRLVMEVFYHIRYAPRRTDRTKSERCGYLQFTTKSFRKEKQRADHPVFH